MPALEQYQIDHPSNILFSSEFWDPRIPPSSVVDPYQPDRPSMLRELLACHPAAIFVESGTSEPQMPVRVYIYGRHDALAGCAGKALPEGYKLTAGDTVARGERDVR